MRKSIVTQLARRNAQNGRWTFEEWMAWYAETDLHGQDMKFALGVWEQFCEDTTMNPDKGQELCNNRLATSLLKLAALTVNSLLQDWLEYMQTPEFETVRNKSRGQKSDEEVLWHHEIKSLRQYRQQAKAGKASSWWTDYFRSGALDQKIKALTKQHAYRLITFENKEGLGTRPSISEVCVASKKLT